MLPFGTPPGSLWWFALLSRFSTAASWLRPALRTGTGKVTHGQENAVVLCYCAICAVADLPAMDLRRRKRDAERTIGEGALENDGDAVTAVTSSSEAAADAVVGAAVRGGSLLMLLALIQVGLDLQWQSQTPAEKWMRRN